MKHFFIFWLTIWLYACSNTNDTIDKLAESDSTASLTDTLAFLPTDTTAGEQLHDSDYGILHHPISVHNTLPLFDLKVHIPDSKIYIYQGKEVEPLQAVELSADIDYESDYYSQQPERYIEAEDFNFDQYKDLKVLQTTGSGGAWFDIYLYDQGKKQFIKHKQLSEFASPTVDTINKTVSYYDIGGMAGAWYTTGTLKWENDQLVTIREEEQTSEDAGSPDVLIKTIYTVDENKELKLASKVRISHVDDKLEKHCLLEGEWTEFDKDPKFIFVESAVQVNKQDGRNGKCE